MPKSPKAEGSLSGGVLITGSLVGKQKEGLKQPTPMGDPKENGNFVLPTENVGPLSKVNSRRKKGILNFTWGGKPELSLKEGENPTGLYPV